MKNIKILVSGLVSLSCLAMQNCPALEEDGRVIRWSQDQDGVKHDYKFKSEEDSAMDLTKAGSAEGILTDREPFQEDILKVTDYSSFIKWGNPTPEGKPVSYQKDLAFNCQAPNKETFTYSVYVIEPKAASGFEEVLPGGSAVEEFAFDPGDTDQEIADILGSDLPRDKGKEPDYMLPLDLG